MTNGRPVVAVIGGGVAGLAAARALARETPGATVHLFEASDRLGGKLKTIRHDGIQIEAGADSFIVRDDEMESVAKELGIAADLIEPAVFGGLVAEGGRLRPLPGGTLLGIPTSPAAALKATVLSPKGKARALLEAVRPGPLTGPDVSVGAFIRQRFGPEVLDKMVDPILAGTRAGDPEQISLAAAMPQVDAAARDSRSVMRGLPRVGKAPRFLSHRGGMSAFVEALAGDLGTTHVHTNSPATSLEPTGSGYTVGAPEGPVDADAVIICVPSGPAAELLRPLSGEAANCLGSIAHASVASVALIYRRADVRVPVRSSGVLIPSKEPGILSAATWWSLKWPHTTDPERFVIRCFVGRAGKHPALALPDDELAAAAATEIGELLNMQAGPTDSVVHRWDDGLPQYSVGHLNLVAAVESTLAGRAIALAGADYRGSGIPDCYRQGVAAARAVLGKLGSARR